MILVSVERYSSPEKFKSSMVFYRLQVVEIFGFEGYLLLMIICFSWVGENQVNKKNMKKT